jgi:PAS domain S-box-containing protein
MITPLRLLVIDDSEDDTVLLSRELRRANFDPSVERVSTLLALSEALDQGKWDVVISDFYLPSFTALEALDLLREKGLDLPFIVTAGALGTQLTVAAMKAGAHDYFMKANLEELPAAVERELRLAVERRDRAQAEAARAGSEARLRALVEHVPAVLYSMALAEDSRPLYISPGIQRLLGFSAEEWLADPDLWHRQLHPDDRQHVLDSIAASRASDDPFRAEYRLLTRWGDEVWVWDEAMVVRDASGGPDLLHGLLLDITWRKVGMG